MVCTCLIKKHVRGFSMVFSWVLYKPQSLAVEHKINSRISMHPNLNVIFHCISSMKTMKGCDFCSKDRSGGFVVFCSLQICYLKHNSISLILCMVLLQGPISVSDFPKNPQKINMQQQHDRKLNHSMTIHYLSQTVGKILFLEHATAQPLACLCS